MKRYTPVLNVAFDNNYYAWMEEEDVGSWVKADEAETLIAEKDRQIAKWETSYYAEVERFLDSEERI